MGSSTSVSYYAMEDSALIQKVKDKVRRKCKLNLKKVSARSQASPLLLFCEVTTTIDKAVNDIVKEARGGDDVFVVTVKVSNRHPGKNKHLSDFIAESTRRLIGDACVFFFDMNLASTDYRNDNKIAFCGIKRFMADVKPADRHMILPHVTFQRHPFLNEPVCFYFEPGSHMEQDTLTFVQDVGQFPLQKCARSDVRSVSPLIVFTLCYTRVDEDANSILRQARDGHDVFLVVIESAYKHSAITISNVPHLSSRTRSRIGESGTLVYSLDCKSFQETSQNMQMIQRLRKFLIDTVEANKSNSLRRSRSTLADCRGTLL
ncbi:uncharacterized protein LOC124135439 [Haliotis rufescens]|uniref:uncharacterized protein LOC124135439 n=1 Tax=Haliotis rufescens TaxID=6454 RepID=UPI00201E8B20|nr:uncharacterized protein LOC124135439 [Haliotis rufescens]XP_048242578.1 uncharacterized protein LOC124135439 [Haliotis rufescens]